VVHLGFRGEAAMTKPRIGWASLTSGECDVAILVAQGLTNGQTAERLFLSKHTVDYHLRQIFTKLDMRSRLELAVLVREHEVVVSDEGPRAWKRVEIVVPVEMRVRESRGGEVVRTPVLTRITEDGEWVIESDAGDRWVLDTATLWKYWRVVDEGVIDST
jgi:DNA-binding CsgD family transcriptional regulator